jgi:hypothetical protein
MRASTSHRTGIGNRSTKKDDASALDDVCLERILGKRNDDA